MNTLIEKGIVHEIVWGSNFGYVLEDNTSFLPTEYKVLQSQTCSCFVRCMKTLYNGKIQLYYLTGAYKPLIALFSTLDPEQFVSIAESLFGNIIEAKSNGFLACQNIDLSFEHIFVDPIKNKVSLIYLPLNQRMFETYSIFENELRTSLVKLISRLNNIVSPKTVQLSSDLSNGALTLEELYKRLKSNGLFAPQEEPPHKPVAPQEEPLHESVAPQEEPPREPVAPQEKPPYKLVPPVRIVSLNAPIRVEINITKDGFVLGKKAEKVDGVLSFNDKISRVHCMINRNGDQYTITDLHSMNGTYVNQVRLQPGKPSPIKHGDVVRLANSDFQIVAE